MDARLTQFGKLEPTKPRASGNEAIDTAPLTRRIA